jgi:hypothetical protein
MSVMKAGDAETKYCDQDTFKNYLQTRIACVSTLAVYIDSSLITEHLFYGNSVGAFYAATWPSMIFLIGPNHSPMFHAMETLPLPTPNGVRIGERGWGQYIYRGRCTRF